MSEQPSMETSPEAPQQTIEQLLSEKRSIIESVSSQLGFDESASMKELRAQVIDEQGEVSYEALSVWRDQAEASVNAIGDKDLFQKAQIGLLLAKASVYLDAKRPNDFYEDIDDAILYASNLGLEDVVEKLRGL